MRVQALHAQVAIFADNGVIQASGRSALLDVATRNNALVTTSTTSGRFAATTRIRTR